MSMIRTQQFHRLVYIFFPGNPDCGDIAIKKSLDVVHVRNFVKISEWKQNIFGEKNL